jgi:hypothetical protein
MPSIRDVSAALKQVGLKGPARRRSYVKRLLQAWSTRILARDKTCRWCGSVKRLAGHHVVARQVTLRHMPAWFEDVNGMALCARCHIYQLKADPDEYIVVRDAHLKTLGVNYKRLRERYMIPAKLSTDQLHIMVLAEVAGKRDPDGGSGG